MPQCVCLHVGTACRTRATFGLAKQFDTPLQAQQHYSKPMESRRKQPRCCARLHAKEVSIPTAQEDDLHSQIKSYFSMLPESECLPVVTKLLQMIVARSLTIVPITIPDDFLVLTLRAMSHLKQSGRSNVVYGLVKGLGQMRADGSDSKLPALRMPMGLLEYVVSFHCSDTLNEVCNAFHIQPVINVASIRLCLVLKITNSGVRLCFLFLGPNGVRFMWVLCGVSQECHKTAQLIQ